LTTSSRRSRIAVFALLFLLCLLPLVLLTGFRGCRESTTTSNQEESTEEATSGQYHKDLLGYAVDSLSCLEEFNSPEVFRQIVERLDPRGAPKPDDPSAKRFDPLLASWPETEMLRQAVDRLSQWIRTQPPPPDWKLDPMLSELPRPLAELPQVKDLGQMDFSRLDGYAIQEAVWMRDVSRSARGEVIDDLQRACNLFDWTVRNVQLEPDDQNRIPQFPWETLLHGRGTATERAWVFILLLRQLEIDAAVLALDAGNGTRDEGNKTERNLQPWCVGVLIEGNVYLFDPLLGLPIPAPNGVTLDAGGRLAIRPASLAQVVADDKLLRRLDVDETRAYGVKAAQLTRVAALLEASPPYLSRRMKAIEPQLTGERRMVLTASPSTRARQWKDAKHIAEARLWRQPFQVLQLRSRLTPQAAQDWLRLALPLYVVYEERVVVRHRDEKEEDRRQSETRTVVHAGALGRGRVLQLKGKFSGDQGAIRYFQLARPSNESLVLSSRDKGEKIVYLWAKQDATYWSGLIAYQRGNYRSAIDYFTNRSQPPLVYPGGPWTVGAQYNLARAYEASGQTQRAILQYGSNASSPGYLGDLLRAKWLRERGK
jgi:hypothetical protein